MNQLHMIKALPEPSIAGAVRLMNDFRWKVAVEQDGKTWHVFAGHKLLLTTDSKDCADVFLYGLSLAYALLPPHISNEMKKFVDDSAS